MNGGIKTNYQQFLKSKEITVNSSGFDISVSELNPMLFDWQKDIVRWALKKGKAALFEDCGLGKTPQQLEWARQVCIHTGGNVLILAPLAVSTQTVREGQKFNIPVTICRDQQDVKPGINITNYEKLEKFNAADFMGIVLDESSILKHHSSKTRQMVTDYFEDTPYKLACTATPSPNDFMELGNHSEFLGVMTRTEMLSTFFVHDMKDTAKWRLKGHAKDKFWQWIASWAVVMQNPADLGYDGTDYILPPLEIKEHIVKVDQQFDADGQSVLFAPTVQTLNERRAARRNSLSDRANEAAEIANASGGQVLIWCDLNDESAELTSATHGAVEVKGADSDEHKTNSVIDFANGYIRCLVSKPKIAGFGINWQNCNTVIFCGLSDSFESYYQAVRRCWRFGQRNPVTVHIIISDAEGAVKANIERKQADAQRMTNEMVKYTKDILRKEIHGTERMSDNYIPTEEMILPEWMKGAA
jgi:hypothetical protein